MKTCLAILICAATAALVIPAAVQNAPGAQPVSCDRACLGNLLEDYISALKAHDPSRLPLAAAGFFDHRGDMRKVKLTDGRVVDAQYYVPWSWQIGELFKIKDNKIDQVEALVLYTPYGNPDVWTDRPRWTPAH